jgi:hypothetical protein
MAPVFSKLNQLGIEPIGTDDLIEPNSLQPLVNRIRRAAEKIRQDWANEQMTMGENVEYETQSAETSTRPTYPLSP